MLSKAKLKSALIYQDIETAKQIIPTVKEFKVMARNKNFHRLIAPTVKLLFSDKKYYKNVFDVSVMTTMFFFTHKVMKDFKYLNEDERDMVDEALMRPLLADETMFFDAIKNFFEFKYFVDTFVMFKNELIKMVVRSASLFWRVISSFSHLQSFCQDYPAYARDAILFVLCNPTKMKELLLTQISETIFAGYCLAHCVFEKQAMKDITPTILVSAKKVAIEHLTLSGGLTLFSGKTDDKATKQVDKQATSPQIPITAK